MPSVTTWCLRPPLLRVLAFAAASIVGACAGAFPASAPPGAVAAAGDAVDTGALSDAATPAVDTAVGNTLPPDTSAVDSASADAGKLDLPLDAPAFELVPVDGGLPDAAPADAPAPDQAVSDQAVADQAATDQSAKDQGPSDTGTADAVCPSTCPLACPCLKDGSGCVVPVCAPKSCAEVDTLMAQWLPKARPCSGATGCQSFEFPACGSAGCFQAPVGATSPAVAVIEQIAAAALALQCPKFGCGCAPPPPSFCFGGQCSFCPPDCKGSCAELLDALVLLAKTQSFCGKSEDCQLLPTDLCAVAGLGCYHIALSKFADLKGIQSLLAAHAQAKCPTADCDCATPSKASCQQGKCVGGG